VKVVHPESNVTVLCLSALGDFINSLPVILALRERCPRGRLTIVCERASTAELARACAVADNVVLLPSSLRKSPLQLVRAFRVLRGLKSHLAVQTFASHGTCGNLLLYATGAAVRSGFDDGRFQCLATSRAPLALGRHCIDLNFDVLEASGLKNLSRPSGRFLPPLEEQATNFSREKLKSDFGSFVVFATGCDPKLFFKRWPNERWAELCRRVCATGRKVVFVGDKAEQQIAASVIEETGSRSALNLCGQTTFHDLASLVASADLTVGIDGMLLHLSAAMDKKCVALFGPTDERLIGPYGQPDAVVRAYTATAPWYTVRKVGAPTPRDAPDYMGSLGVDEVWKAVSSRLYGLP